MVWITLTPVSSERPRLSGKADLRLLEAASLRLAVQLMMMTMMMRPLQPQLSEGKVLIRLPIRRVISAPLF